MKHEIEIPGLPDGWKKVGEGYPNRGEYFLFNGSIKKAEFDYRSLRTIVEKIKPSRIVLAVAYRVPVVGVDHILIATGGM